MNPACTVLITAMHRACFKISGGILTAKFDKAELVSLAIWVIRRYSPRFSAGFSLPARLADPDPDPAEAPQPVNKLTAKVTDNTDLMMDFAWIWLILKYPFLYMDVVAIAEFMPIERQFKSGYISALGLARQGKSVQAFASLRSIRQFIGHRTAGKQVIS